MDNPRLLALLVLVALLLSASPSFAHKFGIKRSARAQLSAEAASLLISLEIPPGKRSALLFRQYDVNQDGRLTRLEADRAARSLMPMALQGLQVEVKGQRPALGKPQLSLKHDEKGRIIVVALMEYSLPRLAAGAERQLILRLLPNPRAKTSFPLRVQLSTVAPLTILSSSQPFEDSRVAMRSLAEGESMTMTARHEAKPKTSKTNKSKSAKSARSAKSP